MNEESKGWDSRWRDFWEGYGILGKILGSKHYFHKPFELGLVMIICQRRLEGFGNIFSQKYCRAMRNSKKSKFAQFLLKMHPLRPQNGAPNPKIRPRRTNFDFSNLIFKLWPSNFLTDFSLILGHLRMPSKSFGSILGLRWGNIFVCLSSHPNSLLGRQPCNSASKSKNHL